MRPNFQGSLSPLPPKTYAEPSVPQHVPCYRILKPCFLDDIMFFEGQVVTWSEEPNEEMEPLNDLARDATNTFFDKIEALGRAASAAKGTAYVSMRRPIEEGRERNTADSRRVELVKGDGGVPVLGARRKIRKVEAITVSALEQAPITDLAASHDLV